MPVNGDIIFDASDAQEFLASLQERFGSIERGSAEMGGIIGATVFQDILDHFDKETGPAGAWDSWSDSYAKYMESIGKGGNKILQDSGRLRQGITPSNYRPTQEGVIFYNDLLTAEGFPYAHHHDEGSKNPRPFMWVSSDAMDRIAEQLLNWIADVK